MIEECILVAMFEKMRECLGRFTSQLFIRNCRNDMYYYAAFERGETYYDLNAHLPDTLLSGRIVTISLPITSLQDLRKNLHSDSMQIIDDLLRVLISRRRPPIVLDLSYSPKVLAESGSRRRSSIEEILDISLDWKLTWGSFESYINQSLVPNDFFTADEKEEILEAGRKADPDNQTWRDRDSLL